MVVNRHTTLFDGGLGMFYSTPVTLELKKNVEIVHVKPFQVPHSHRLMFNK